MVIKLGCFTANDDQQLKIDIYIFNESKQKWQWSSGKKVAKAYNSITTIIISHHRLTTISQQSTNSFKVITFISLYLK